MDVKKYFKKSGLIPAIITDAENGEVLMLAYMNEESLQKTLETGYTWFWSRSRQELWNKGATSGHFQKVVGTRLRNRRGAPQGNKSPARKYNRDDSQSACRINRICG